MPLLAISALMRVIASAIGTALLTRTIPSSLSAQAQEAANTNSKINASGAQNFGRRLARFLMGRLLFVGACRQAWLPRQDERLAPCYEMPGCSRLDSRPLSAGDARRLSNRLGNGISKLAGPSL